MPDDLVERVAREFCVVDGTDPCEVVCGLCLHRARLVVAVVLEEAAKVCLSVSTDALTKVGREHEPYMRATAEDCAAAIRALAAQEPTDPGPASGSGS